MKVKCQRCEKEWEYTGEKIEVIKKYPQYVTCPRCRTSVKLVSNEKNKIKKELNGERSPDALL